MKSPRMSSTHWPYCTCEGLPPFGQDPIPDDDEEDEEDDPLE